MTVSRKGTVVFGCLLALTATAGLASEREDSNLPANIGVVRPGLVYRGAQPTRSESSSQYEALKRILGVRTILKLNSDQLAEESKECRRLGIELIVLPFDAKRIGEPDTLQEACLADKELADTANWPIYVHCQAGQDRTGYIVGRFRLKQDKWKPDCVLAEVRHYRSGARGFFSAFFYSEIPERLRAPLRICGVEAIGRTPAGDTPPIDEFKCAGSGDPPR